LIRERNLLDLLAGLYGTKERSYTIIDAAKLDRTLIEFSDRAVDNWNSILSEAKEQDKLEALVEVVCQQYENKRTSLLTLLQVWIGVPDSPEPLAIPPQPKKYVTQDPDVLIARELHWDRNSVATTFLGMMKRQEKYPYQVMGLQDSRDADLDSLIDRFEEVCQRVQKPKPLLYAKILLSPALATPTRVAVEVLDNLRTAARKSAEEIVKGQVAKFDLALEDVDRSSSGTAVQSLSEHQLARRLKDCLEDVTQHSTVVLLLPRFHELRDPSSAWLRDTWLVSHACQVTGLVTVIAAEKGLQSLRGMEKKGIYFPDQLPAMTWEDFFFWAQEGFGFKWFTEEIAQNMHEKCKGNPREFALYLELRKMELGIRGT
jgi:hypothetical protein